MNTDAQAQARAEVARRLAQGCPNGDLPGCHERFDKPTQWCWKCLCAITSPSTEAQAIDVQAIKARLTSGEQRRCPFDSADCKVCPDEPCPVCGDVDDLDVPVEEHKPSRCVAINLRVLHGEALAVLDAYEALGRERNVLKAALAEESTFTRGYVQQIEALGRENEQLREERDKLDSAMRRHLCEHDMADWIGCSMDHVCGVCDDADHGGKGRHAEFVTLTAERDALTAALAEARKEAGCPSCGSTACTLTLVGCQTRIEFEKARKP